MTWLQPTLQRVPRGFRGKSLLQRVGTQSFLRVQDGWFFGSSGFEGQGFFVHVTDSGVITQLLPHGAAISSIVERTGRYFGIDGEAVAGDPGALIEISRNAEKKWEGKTLMTLPGYPTSYAIAPMGELLLGDGPNVYAIVESHIVPLKCENKSAESFFTEH